MWVKTWASRQTFFQGDGPLETYISICNQSNDQLHDKRDEVNLVSNKGGSTKDALYLINTDELITYILPLECNTSPG